MSIDSLVAIAVAVVILANIIVGNRWSFSTIIVAAVASVAFLVLGYCVCAPALSFGYAFAAVALVTAVVMAYKWCQQIPTV